MISRSARARSSTGERVAARPRPARRGSAALGEPHERVVAALVAFRLAVLLRALLRPLEPLLGLARALAERARVELVDREALVHEHERMRAGHLQEALALREADH